MSKIIPAIVFCVSLLIIGCNSVSPTPTLNIPTRPYPGPVTGAPVNPVRFQIDRPVKVGDTVVKGSGPAGIPIVIANVTTMGTILGGDVIGDDNRFSVDVTPLEANTRIGLEIGDLTGTSYVWDQFQTEPFKGSGALIVPLVGYFQDTVVVQQ